jgi:hypothetical protein
MWLNFGISFIFYWKIIACSALCKKLIFYQRLVVSNEKSKKTNTLPLEMIRRQPEIVRCVNLRGLSLCGNTGVGLPVVGIITEISDDRAIRLDLSHNHLTLDTLPMIATWVNQCFPSLLDIDLSNNCIQKPNAPKETEATTKALADLLEVVDTINLAHNPWDISTVALPPYSVYSSILMEP